jgi:hypothetical protein
MAIYMVPMMGIGFIMQSNNKASFNIGCLSILLLPFLQVAALIDFVLTMWPIILGISDQAAWAFPFQLIGTEPIGFLKLVGIMTVVAIIFAFVPIFGRFQSIQTLLLGVLTLGFVLVLVESAFPNTLSRDFQFWPGFWFMIGLLVVGAMMSWIGLIVSALLATPLESVAEGFSQILIFPLAAIFGFIPVFMYGSWLGAQLHGG